MHAFETLIGLLLVAITLAAVARRVGAPYPALLALGGAVLAFIPGVPVFSIPPDLALALFVAPVLLDAAFDASPRDLRENWVPVASLVVVSVLLTTMAVAVVARMLVPAMPWAAAVALGAVVAPPDATAAIAVLRQVRIPHRLLTILEGESLLNDATALLIYRLAVGAVVAGTFSIGSVAPAFLLAVAGSLVAGPVLAWLLLAVTSRVSDIPTAIILQFITTFGVWIAAERVGLSGVLTVVCFAFTASRSAPERTPARIRVPSYAVWDTVVFVVNVLAFVFIGLQMRPILSALEPGRPALYFRVALAVLVTVIGIRIVWVMSHNAVLRWRIRRHGFHPPRPTLRPSVRSGLVVSWSGMRGIVTLAAALALPIQAGTAPFPFRDLIIFTAFAVVLGTLVIQGLTLRPLLQALDLRDDDPVGREVELARERALLAALATLEGEDSPAAEAVREELTSHLEQVREEEDEHGHGPAHAAMHRRALAEARRVVLEMRARGDIGDGAFHRLEEQLDWVELGVTVEREGAS
ncbi:MAG TPA: sodium:proton antiporter [Vicinamibacteria bacterium]|nr:sodium:proton antiporter [Vicinamibacteria bacterium]